jgi:hypothetical protein
MTHDSQLRFEKPACQDMSLGAQELNRTSELLTSSVGLRVRLYEEDFMYVVVTRM